VAAASPTKEHCRQFGAAANKLLRAINAIQARIANKKTLFYEIVSSDVQSNTMALADGRLSEWA
jgi:hypothetical protein